MFVGGVLNIGNSSSDDYLFAIHETHEDGKFYYLWVGVPLLGAESKESHLTNYYTYRTNIEKVGVFENVQTTLDGLKVDVLSVSRNDIQIIANDSNIEEKFAEFLGLVVEKYPNDFYSIPYIINKLREYHPNLLI